MKLTRNLKIFILLNLVTSALLYWLSVENDIGVKTTNNSDGTVTISSWMPLLWMLIALISFFVLYKSDNQRSTRSNLGFSYHVAITGVVLLAYALGHIAFLSLGDGSASIYDLIPVGALSFILGIHCFFARKTLKGHEPKKVFK